MLNGLHRKSQWFILFPLVREQKKDVLFLFGIWQNIPYMTYALYRILVIL